MIVCNAFEFILGSKKKKNRLSFQIYMRLKRPSVIVRPIYGRQRSERKMATFMFVHASMLKRGFQTRILLELNLLIKCIKPHNKANVRHVSKFCISLNEPRREKTGLRGFRPGPSQTGLYKLRKELEA